MSTPHKIILIVEDNPDITNLIRLVLRKAPADLLPAVTATEAWSQMAKHRPDLILLDMMLPGINGLDFLAQVREDPSHKSLPVIVVSIRADTIFRRRAHELGVLRYLFKPFSPAVLRQEVELALGVDWKSYWSKSPHGVNHPKES